jgi:hypothetical protein
VVKYIYASWSYWFKLPLKSLCWVPSHKNINHCWMYWVVNFVDGWLSSDTKAVNDLWVDQDSAQWNWKSNELRMDCLKSLSLQKGCEGVQVRRTNSLYILARLVKIIRTGAKVTFLSKQILHVHQRATESFRLEKRWSKH